MDAALGTRTLLWFGHELSCERMLLEHERSYGLGMHSLVIVGTWNTNVIMDSLVTVCTWNTNGIWFGHGFSGDRRHLEHERTYGLGMDALVSVCTWNTNGIMVWAWMLW